LVKAVQSVGEQTEGGADKDLAGLSLFQGSGNLTHAFTGGNHVVDNEHVLALHVRAEELIGDDGVASVDDAGIIASLIEHAHVQPEHVGDVDGTAHTALIGADDHHVIGVDDEVVLVAQQVLDELIGGLYGFKAMQRNRVLNSGIMGVEGDDVFHAHVHQLLQRDGAVKGFSAGALMLSAFIEIGHDHVDPAGLSADS